MAKAPLKRTVPKCPFCKSVDLGKIKIADMKIDCCHHCEATWHIPKGKK